jgi:cephalosporin hydroxylase
MSDIATLREHLSTLTPSQVLAVSALTGGSTHAEAAQVAGVARETVSRWIARHPAFRATLIESQVALMAEHNLALARLRTRATEVADRALTAILDRLDSDENVDPVATLRAVLPLTASTAPIVPLDALTMIDDDLKRLKSSVLSTFDLSLDDRYPLALSRLAEVSND